MEVLEPATTPSLWRAARTAVAGGHPDYDYTNGPIGRAVLLLAVPMVLEMLMESVFAVADVFYVSRLGPDAVAVVGLTESLLTIIYTVAIGLSIGATATVARRIGERDREGAAHAAAQAITLGLVVSLAIAVIGGLFAPDLLAIMGASNAVIEMGGPYARIMLMGNASILLLFLINAILRGSGNPAAAMRTLWIANAINIVLAPVLIFGPGPLPALGVTGAAVATTTGRGLGALYAYRQLTRAGGRVPLAARHWGLDPRLMLGMIRLSGAGTLQGLIGTASWIGLVRIMASFGSAALAGYTIAIRIVLFALLPSWGMSNAAATMVGQALGAGKPDRAEAAVWLAGRYNALFLGIVGMAFVIFAPLIASIFAEAGDVHRYASDGLRVISLGFLFYGFGMVFTNAFNGAGDTWTPTWLNFAMFWLLEIPLAWALARPLGFGPHGVFVSIAVAFSLFAVAGGLLFRRGRWKRAVV
jgi:putative MATE family efflux protein